MIAFAQFFGSRKRTSEPLPLNELSGKPRYPFETLHQLEVAKLIAGEGTHRFAEQLRAWLPDQRGGASGCVAVLLSVQSLIEVDAAETDHGAIGYLDATKPVLATQRNTAAEVFECAAHLALGIGGVCESGESA
jgi:hypothetical protein